MRDPRQKQRQVLTCQNIKNLSKIVIRQKQLRRDMQGRGACGWSEAEGTGREGKPGIARLQMGFAP